MESRREKTASHCHRGVENDPLMFGNSLPWPFSGWFSSTLQDAAFLPTICSSRSWSGLPGNMGSAIFSDAAEASGHQLTTHSPEIKTLKTITVSASSNLKAQGQGQKLNEKNCYEETIEDWGQKCQGSNLNSAMPHFFFFLMWVSCCLYWNYSFLPWRIKILEGRLEKDLWDSVV